jgi:biotin carboxyl carrier protein
MERFKITVNGKSYEVEIEKIKIPGGFGQTATPVSAAKTPVAAVPTNLHVAETKVRQEASAVSAVANGAVIAPMPGTVLAINVNEGDYISEGQILLILEAMKMENEIRLPYCGKVAEVLVAKGQSVNAGDVLITIQQGERRIS